MTKDEYDDLSPMARKDFEEESEDTAKKVEDWREYDEGKINFDH